MSGAFVRAFARIAAVALTGLALAPPAGAGLAEEALRAEIERFALDYAGEPPFAMEIPALRDFTSASAPFRGVSVGLTTQATEPVRGSLPVTVSLRSAGREFKRGVVTVRLRADEAVWVAARTLEAGEVISRRDLRMDPSAAVGTDRARVEHPSQVVGRRATRVVREGTVLRPGHFGDVPVIVRGGMVRIRLQRGPMRIEAMGRAREDGAPGTPIRVLNLESRREIVGIVKADGIVHVEF